MDYSISILFSMLTSWLVILDPILYLSPCTCSGFCRHRIGGFSRPQCRSKSWQVLWSPWISRLRRCGSEQWWQDQTPMLGVGGDDESYDNRLNMAHDCFLGLWQGHQKTVYTWWWYRSHQRMRIWMDMASVHIPRSTSPLPSSRSTAGNKINLEGTGGNMKLRCAKEMFQQHRLKPVHLLVTEPKIQNTTCWSSRGWCIPPCHQQFDELNRLKSLVVHHQKGGIGSPMTEI